MLTNAWESFPPCDEQLPTGVARRCCQAWDNLQGSDSECYRHQAGSFSTSAILLNQAARPDRNSVPVEQPTTRGEERALPERTPELLWETALGQLELQVTRPNFETWLRNTSGLQLEGDLLTVGVPSDFAIEWLRSRMTAPINRTVSQLLGRTITVSFQVLGAQPLPSSSSLNGRLERSSSPPPPIDLNRRYSFDTFSVVKSNRLAHRAALQLASGESTHSPLVLFGASGLGKSHLLHAIAHHASGAGKRVCLLTGDAFADRYGRAVAAGQRQAFRDLFVDCDLFLLDDLQTLANKPGSQTQFFHIFNALLSSDCRIALTIDSSPATLTNLSSRLRSRLSAGLEIELRIPPPAECLDILRTKAAQLKHSIPEATLQLILSRPYNHIRDLEGALNRLDAYIDLTGDAPADSTLQEVLSPLQSSPTLSPSIILQAVCNQLAISQADLVGPSRSRDITFARHIAMYLLRYVSKRPLTQIGALLGGRDHSTVSSGSHRIKQELASLPETQAQIQQLLATLQQSSAA